MPARRPPGTLMMSPRRNWLSEATAAARWFALRCLAASPSSSDSSRRSRKYSAKSPRSQVTASSSSSRRPRCAARATPATARSAWNWAKDDSRIAVARSIPACPTRFTAML